MVPELDVAVNQREERMVASYADIVSRFNLCATLAHDNAAGRYQLPIVAFHTKHLGVAIPAIAGATHSFFMLHDLYFLLGLIHLACSRLGLSRLSWSLYLLLGDLFIPSAWRLAGNQTLAIGHNIIDCQDCQFLAMTAAVAITFLRLVLENNQFFAAGLPGSGGNHHRILYQGGAYHRRIRIRDQQHV